MSENSISGSFKGLVFSSEPIDIQVKFKLNREKQNIFALEKLQPENYSHFSTVLLVLID